MVVFLLSVMLHLLLITSLLAFAYSLHRTILGKDDQLPLPEFETFLRTGTALCGLLVSLAARLAGLNAAEFTVRALSEASPLVLTASAVGPGGAGVALGWYLIRRFRKSRHIAKRILVFVGTITTLEFILVYAETMRQEGLDLGPAVIPNVSFVVGVILYVALTHNPEQRGAGTPYRKPGRGARQ